MKDGFVKFIFTKLTVKMFVTLIVYNMFGVLLNELIVPFTYSIIDPNKKLDNLKMTHGDCTINYGKSVTDLLIGFILLFIVYSFLI